MTLKIFRVALLLMAAILLFQSRQITQWVFSSAASSNRSANPSAVLATVTVVDPSSTGTALYHPSRGNSLSAALQVGQSLSHGQRVSTLEGGRKVVLRFARGEVVEIGRNSLLEIEQLPEGKILLSVLSGQLLVQQVKELSSLWVQYRGQLSPIAHLVSKKPLLEEVSTAPAEPQTPGIAAVVTEEIKVSAVREIQSVMANQKFWLDKCFAAHLQMRPDSSGEIQVFFDLRQDGQVKEARVHRSTMNDKKMDQCVLQIVQRSRFTGVSQNQRQFIFPFQFATQ